MAYDLEDKPQLRWPLDISEQRAEGERVFVLSDPTGLTSERAFVPEPLMALISRFDGSRTIRSICNEGASVGLTPEFVFQLLGDLESLHLLDTPSVRAHLRQIREQFEKQTTREPSHAHSVYAGKVDDLRQQLNGFAEQVAFRLNEKPTDVVAAFAPHIDYRRGWQTYGVGHHLLEAIPRPDVIVLIGTSHQIGHSIFRLTKKHFASPFGTFRAEVDVIEALADQYGTTQAYKDEFLHKHEHSLDLQLPFLGLRYQDETLPTIIPVLVGSFHDCVRSDTVPKEDAEIGRFIEALAGQVALLHGQGKRVLFYAGIDLAHVGQHFGDPHRISDNRLPEIESRDRSFLEAMLTQSSEDVFAHIASDQDARRICGFPSVYTILATLELLNIQIEGRCLEYRQAVDTAQDCVVTFASGYWQRTST